MVTGEIGGDYYSHYCSPHLLQEIETSPNISATIIIIWDCGKRLQQTRIHNRWLQTTDWLRNRHTQIYS